MHDTRFLTAPAGPLRVENLAGDAPSVEFSLVVPTYNEAVNIEPFLREVQATLDPLLADSYEVVLVDDDSPDRTWEIGVRLLEVFPQLRVLRRSGTRELSSAVIRGWQVARGRLLATMNADFQHPPALLNELLGAAPDADLVVASRFAPGGGVNDWSLGRRLLAATARQIGTLALPAIFERVSDPLSGYYLVPRSAIAGVEFHPVGFKTLIEVLARGRVHRIQECGYRIQRRRGGESKLRARDCVKYLQHLKQLRRAEQL